MDVRKLEAMLQVAREKAEEERREWEEKNKAKKKELMKLRQATAAFRKEKEAYEAMYGHSELGSLRDDDSVRSNSLRWAMSGSSERSQGLMKETRASNREVVKATQQTMPPPREVRGPWHVVQEKPKNRDRAQAIADEADEASEEAKDVERTRERESTQRQVPTTKATDPRLTLRATTVPPN